MNRLKRARAYLASLPPAVSGSGGHNTTFMVACWLVRFGLSPDEAWELIQHYNQRCQPPWTDRELAHKLADARRVVSPRMPVRPAAPPPVEVEVDSSRFQSGTGPPPATVPDRNPFPPDSGSSESWRGALGASASAASNPEQNPNESRTQ